MVKLLKNIPIYVIRSVAEVLKLAGSLLIGLATIFYAIEVSLHKLLNTETGKQLKEMEKTVQSILNLHAQVTAKLQQSNVARVKEENKLAAILKEDANVVQLGKKKNDDTKN